MLRTVLSFILVFACCVGSYAEDNASSSVSEMLSELVPPKATKVQTLGVDKTGKIQPAVHVNANGVEYGSGEANATLNKLRSARGSVLLPPNKSAQKVTPSAKGVKVSSDAFSGTSSRRAKPARINTNAVVTEPALQTPKETKKPKLSSVMARPSKTLTPAQPAAPKLAEPTPIAKNIVASPVDRQSPAQKTELAQLPATPAGSSGSSSPIELSPQIPFTNINIESVVPNASVTTGFGDAATNSSPAASNSVAAPKTTPMPTKKISVPAQATPTIKTSKTPTASRNVIRDPSAPPATQATIRSNGPRQTADPFAGMRTRDPQPVTSKAPVATQASSSSSADPVLLSNRSPALVVKTHGKRTIRVGRVATYYITATNTGDLVAEDVIVSVNMPDWAELTRNHATSGIVGVEPNSNGDNVMRWSVRNLQPNVEQRLRIDLIPRASRPIELGVTWNFKSVSAKAKIQVQEPKLQMTVVGPSDIQYGDTKLYTITVSNPGTGDAENVALTLLPINDGSGVPSRRDLGTIKAGSRRTIEVELTARQAGELAVRAKATADGNLQADGTQEVRVRRANLIVEAMGPAKRYAGTPARFTVKVTNSGDATAHDVVAAAALPMASKYVRSSNAGIYDQERGRVKWNIGSLRPGAFQVVEVTSVLTGSGSNKLDVRAIGANKLEAAANAVTLVESRADLKLSVEDPAGVISPGTEMTYEVNIVNRGTKAADNVNLVGFFSEGIEPVAIHGWRGDVEVGQVTMQTIPHIAPGQEIIIKVIAKASKPGNHVFRAELSTKVPLTKLAVEEWTVFHSDDQQAGLDVEQQADASGFTPAVR